MGMEIQTETLEEMCDLMCGNVLPEEKPEYWIFTFGCGQPHAGKYVKIRGSYYEARQKMITHYGKEWCFQYSEKDWENMKNDPNRWYPLETELEVIE